MLNRSCWASSKKLLTAFVNSSADWGGGSSYNPRRVSNANVPIPAMVNKNNNGEGAQGKTEGFYGSPYKAGSRVLAPRWYGASILSRAIRKLTEELGHLRSHLGIQLESSHTEGPPITSRLCCSLSLGLKIWAKLGNRILGLTAPRALDREWLITGRS